MPVVEIENLHKAFNGLIALDGVNLHVDQGEVFCLLGPDGAGKTTLLRILAGVMISDAGSLKIFDKDVAADPEAAKPFIGYLSQRFSLYPNLTVAENIDFYARLFGIKFSRARERKDRLLEFSRLGPYSNRLARHLSGGMKQKLALSCALIHTPKLLILDEPTTGVDPISRREFWKILYDLVAEGITIIFASPYMDEAERANRVALLYKGKIIACDTPDNFRARYNYNLIELITDDNRQAREILQDRFKRDNVVFFGDKLHIKVTDFQTDRIEIENALTSRGLKITSLEQIKPGMEDIFINAIV